MDRDAMGAASAGTACEGARRHRLRWIAFRRAISCSNEALLSDAPATLEHVSDTARWVALYRAMESERPDALFRDPYARRLAGKRGEQVLAGMPKGKAFAWPMIVRTAVMDELILRAI